MSLTRVFLGLGSNIEREPHLVAGLDALAGLLSDMRCSPVFESHAVGIKSGNFFNLVVVGDTELSLLELDRRLKFIEADNGRYAPDRKGLPLDIDVLLFGEQVGNFNGLILPIGFAVVLFVGFFRRDLLHGYKPPMWMLVLGAVTLVGCAWMGWSSIATLPKLWA